MLALESLKAALKSKEDEDKLNKIKKKQDAIMSRLKEWIGFTEL